MSDYDGTKCQDCKRRAANVTITQPRYTIHLCGTCARRGTIGQALERIYGYRRARELMTS